MNSTIAKHDDGTIDVVITIPWDTIKKEYDKVVDEKIKQIEVKGFRKGKAPRAKAEQYLDKGKVYEEVIRQIIPQIYSEAVKKHGITPIIQPDITLDKAKEGKDWQITAKTAQLPKIQAKNYKKIVQNAKAELKKDKLWIPGKNDENKKESPEQIRQKQLSAILEALAKNITVKVPSLLIKKETDRRLTNLYDEIKKLGLTIETYAKSKNMTPAQIRKKVQDEVEKTYQLEFILDYITEQEKIVVSDKEIEELISKTTDKKEKEALSKNRYYLANMLRRQKTLDRLLTL